MQKTKISSGALTLPVLNMGLRGAALAGRFGLALYLARFLSLADVGLFGLVTGVTNMMPVAAGWGLNYFLNREIVGKAKLVSGKRVRDRLAVTLFSLGVLLVPATPLVLAMHILPDTTLVLLAAAIIVLECIAFDMHGALISLERPLAANALLFMRSAAWIFPAAALGAALPAWRTLDVVFAFWLGGLIVNFIALIWILRAWPLRAIMDAAIDRIWIVQTIRKSGLVYLSDLGIAGTIFIDRYVVDHFLGLSLTGVFTLYWSIANAMHVLVSSGIIQISFPKLVALHKRGAHAEGARFARRMLMEIACLGVALSVVAALCFPPLLDVIGRQGIAAYAPVFWVMLGGVCVRLVADGIGMQLASRHLDRPWALTNMLGIVLAFVFSVAGIKTFGLIGAGIGTIATYAALCAVRLWILARIRPRKGGDILNATFDVTEEV